MPSVYLQPSDYTAFGAASNSTVQQVTQASAVIDGYLRRKEGLIWLPDYQGNPCYMASPTPMYTVTSTATILPGANVNVTVTGPVLQIKQGDVAIVEKGNANTLEACQVASINGNVITLVNVSNTHTGAVTLDFGLTLFEEKYMPAGRPLTNLSQTPVARMISGAGQYGYTRRGDTNLNDMNTYNLLATFTQFGGPPEWVVFTPDINNVTPTTGTVWAPAGVLIAYYSQIRFWYIAGWTYANLPYEIKQACANIMNAALNYPLGGAIKSMRAGDTAIERFSASFLDDDTKQLLDPYRARVMG